MGDDLLSRLEALLGERYHLHGEIARGGMARVYRAGDLVSGTDVAIKVLRPELAATLGHDRFLREIRILGRLRHPNVLPLLDSRELGGTLYYVMPYIPGSSLQRRLEREGPLRLEEVVRIARGLAAALDYAHRSDVIHRDVKPGTSCSARTGPGSVISGWPAPWSWRAATASPAADSRWAPPPT